MNFWLIFATEVVVRSCFLGKVFSKISPNSQHIWDSKRLWHRCFPVDFAKCLRIPFFTWIPLVTASENLKSPVEEILFKVTYEGSMIICFVLHQHCLCVLFVNKFHICMLDVIRLLIFCFNWNFFVCYFSLLAKRSAQFWDRPM